MRTPPEMPLGLPFTVDTWGPSRRYRRHRFITHAHTDHIAGAWAGPGDTVYATQLTMRLALQLYPQLERVNFVEMEVGKRLVVDDPAGAFSVTAYDANHCPGAVMLLFDGPFGTILHTGDCRLTSDCVRKLLLKLEANLCRLDTVYLDLTFSKFLEFPSKESAVQQVIACISKHSRAPVIYLACERLGQEEILKEVSRSFRSKIYVDKGLYWDCFNTLSQTVPEIITDDPACCFQVLPVKYKELSKIATKKLEEARASDQLEPLFIRPSAFWYSNACGPNQKPSLTEAEKDCHGVWRVCFSNHSSGNELEQALQLLQPQWVISTTPPNFASELSYVRRRYLSHTTQGHAPSSIWFRTTSRGKEDYEYFVRGIPFPGQSPRVVQIEETWVDHRTFGLSMRVNCYISEHTINMMGKAIMSEQRDAHFLKHVFNSELGKMLQGPSTCQESISNYLSEPNQGFKPENMDAVFVPLLNCKTWYLLVANFWKRRFEVLSPMGCTDELITQAQFIVCNFREAFHSAYPQLHTVTTKDMDITFHTISNSHNELSFTLKYLMQYSTFFFQIFTISLKC